MKLTEVLKVDKKNKEDVLAAIYECSRNKQKYINLSLGENICRKLNLRHTSRIKFSYDEDNKAVWFLSRSSDGRGYCCNSQCKLREDQIVSVFVKIRWTYKENCQYKSKTKFNYVYHSDGILIYPPSEEDYVKKHLIDEECLAESL